LSGLIDVHAHLAALPDGANGCLISRKMMRGPALRFTAWRERLPLDRPEEANRLFLSKLVRELSASEDVSAAVALGMDGAYDASGRLDEGGTDFLISNDYVFAAARQEPVLLPGASINPQRRDALDELERCAERGAALIKTLPNAQRFDPGRDRYRPFYRRMGELGLPLLSHVGFEFSLIGHDQSVGDLDRLRVPLSEGAAVIAAHGCSSGLVLFEKHFDTMLAMAREFPRFFVDVSALTLPNRVGALLRIRRRPELFDRLLFGTDYPLPCMAYPALAGGGLRGWRLARAASNRFDRQARVLRALGVRCGADPRKILSPRAFA